jgi:hypothetical protein
VLTALRLSEDPAELLARHETELDTMYRDFAGRLNANTAVTVDDTNRLHVAALDALDVPPSLIGLRRRVAKMLPAIDIGELILWYLVIAAGVLQAFWFYWSSLG